MSIYDIDPLDVIYQHLINDDNVMMSIGMTDKIYKYHVPEEYKERPPIVRLHPISELPTVHADNTQLAWHVIIQIDVWAEDNPRHVAMKIHESLKRLNFKQSTPTFDFDPDTYLIRDGRRYEGVLIINKRSNE